MRLQGARIVLAVALGAGLALATAQAEARAKKLKDSACETDRDCVMVLEGCCKCNAGGRRIPITKKTRAKYETKRLRKCKKAKCTPDPALHPSCSASPVCKNNKCVLESMF